MKNVSLEEREQAHKRELYAMECEKDFWKNRAEELEEEIKPYKAVCSMLLLVYDALFEF